MVLLSRCLDGGFQTSKKLSAQSNNPLPQVMDYIIFWVLMKKLNSEFKLLDISKYKINSRIVTNRIAGKLVKSTLITLHEIHRDSCCIHNSKYCVITKSASHGLFDKNTGKYYRNDYCFHTNLPGEAEGFYKIEIYNFDYNLYNSSKEALSHLRGFEDSKDNSYYIDGIKLEYSAYVNKLKNAFNGAKNLFKVFNFSEYEIEKLGISQVDNYLTFNTPGNYEKFYKELDEANISKSKLITLFHGTSYCNAHEIALNGIKVSRCGSLGRGVYAAKWDKASAFAYSRGERDNILLAILEIEVILNDPWSDRTWKDTPFNIESKEDRANNRDIEYYGFNRPEWCIRDSNRVLLKKIHLAIN